MRTLWQAMQVGDSATVRPKRRAGRHEIVTIAAILPKTLADGHRFESDTGQIYTKFQYDLASLENNA